MRPSSSLPEDRSLWPSFLSGGTLPLVVPSNPNDPNSVNNSASAETEEFAAADESLKVEEDEEEPTSTFGSYTPAHLSSSSVPASSILGTGRVTRAGSSGPRLHDFSISKSTANVTRVGSGVIGVASSNSNSSDEKERERERERPGALPIQGRTTRSSHRSNNHSSAYGSVGAGSFATPPPGSFTGSSLSHSYYHSGSSLRSSIGPEAEGVSMSIPSSSIRSGSRSRSGSGSRDSDEAPSSYIDNAPPKGGEDVRIRSSSGSTAEYDTYGRGRVGYGYGYSGYSSSYRKDEEDQFDMDMDVDEGVAAAGHGKGMGMAGRSELGDVSEEEEEWDGEMEMEMD
jgi:hypothetical protein